MKEITIRLADQIAELVQVEAEQIGLTSEELLKYVVGRYAAERIPRANPGFLQFLGAVPGGPFGSFDQINANITKTVLKAHAQAGALKCKNCTMALTPEDVDKGICHTCQAPIQIDTPQKEE